MMASAVPVSDFDRYKARVEALPERRDQAFDTLAGSVVRIFSQLNTLERAYRDERQERLRLRQDLDKLRDKMISNPRDRARITNAGEVDTRGSAPGGQVIKTTGKPPPRPGGDGVARG
jgi:hypothetical protein